MSKLRLELLLSYGDRFGNASSCRATKSIEAACKEYTISLESCLLDFQNTINLLPEGALLILAHEEFSLRIALVDELKRRKTSHELQPLLILISELGDFLSVTAK